MDYVKYFFGILLLGVAISIFSEIELFSALYLWGIYFIFIGAFIYPWQTAQNQSLVWQKLLRSLSILSLTWGIITLTGAGMGHTDTQAIKEKYGVYGYPAFLMIDSDATPQTDAIHYGYESAQELFDVLDLNAE